MQFGLSTARLIAHMMCPEREMETLSSLSPDMHSGLLRACFRNKVPLLSLDTDVADLGSFYASELFQRARAEEYERWKGFREEYLVVHQAFRRADIKDVLIKSADIAPALPYKSDNMDTLVPLAQGVRCREILLDLGYIEVKNVEEPHKFLFRKFHLGDSVSAIHLHEFVGWGTGFMEDERVLAHARPSTDDPDVLIPSPEDGLLVTLAHAFYEDKEVKLGDLWKAISLLQRCGLDWDEMYRQVTRRGWREGLDTTIWLWAELERDLYGEHSFPQEIVQRAHRRLPKYCQRYLEANLREEPTFPFKVSFGFSKRHYYGKVYRDETLSLGQKVRDVFLHSLAGIKRRLPFSLQRSMLITFSGVDGSGKTSQVNALARALRTCEVDVTVAWSRGASSAFTDAIIRLIKPFLPRRENMDVTTDTRQAKVARKSVWLRHPLLRFGWRWLVVCDLLLRCWARILWPLLRSRVVLGDRYVYDALVELAAILDRNDAVHSFAARLLIFLCPRPNLAYLLDVPADEALSRQPDEDLEFLKRQILVYHRMALCWGMTIVDANGNLAELTDRITHEVLDRYYSLG